MAENYEADRLAERIKSYSKSYYEGNPEISDDAFDLLVEQLRRIDPDNPVLNKVGWGYKVETDPNATKPHKYEVAKFEDKVRNVENLRIKKGEGVITPKIDGGSVCCYYVKGELDYALTRGDGINGFDITPKMQYIVPDKLIDESFTGMVRGEITIDEKVFDEKFSEKYESNRNLAIGQIRRRTITLQELEDLTFVAYTVRGVSDNPIDSKTAVFNWLRVNGFICVDIIPSPDEWNDESFRELILGYRELHRYPIDGIVITSEKYRRMTDGTYVPVCEMAYKTMSDSAITTIERMEWNLSRTGRMVPVVNVSPVSLSGATVRRATAFNAQYVVENHMGEGSEIRIQRSGEVIPNIVEVLSDGDPKLPDLCPSCHHKLSWVGTDLKCVNPECGDKNESRLWTWTNTLAPVKGLGYNAKKDLFDGMGIDSIDSLYDHMKGIKEWARNNFTPVRYQKVCDMADQLTKGVPAWKFFVACSIPGCGGSSGKALANHLDEILLDPVTDNLFENILSIKGASIGTKEWVVSHLDDIRRWANYLPSVASQQDIDQGYTPIGSARKYIAVTGKLSKSRSQFFEEMARYGYEQGSMANAMYLVTNNPDSNSNKMKDARRRGVIVVSEEQFREIAGAPSI